MAHNVCFLSLPTRAVEHCKEVTPEIEKLKLQTEKK